MKIILLLKIPVDFVDLKNLNQFIDGPKLNISKKIIKKENINEMDLLKKLYEKDFYIYNKHLINK